jgi:pimeloyl-ACP methyl ester carboxylesterase
MSAERSNAEPQERMIRVLGQRIRVDVRPGLGVPLVLCNGIGAGLEVLDPLVDGLPPDIPVIRFDVPGTGGSPNSPLPYGFPYLGWLLGRVLTELGIGQIDILGLSWGGALAQQFAFQNPRRARRLVLVSTATGAMMVPAHHRVLLKMATPRRFGDPEYAADIAAEIYGGSVRTDPEPVADADRRRYRRSDHPGRQCPDHALPAAAFDAAPAPGRPHRRRRQRRHARPGDCRISPHKRRTTKMTVAMDTDKTDFYSFELLLDDGERAVLHSVRDFMRSEVAPIVTEHWAKATFPFEVAPVLGQLGIAGLPYRGYGCPGRSYLLDGMVAMELARWDPSISTFHGVHSGLSMGSIYLCGNDEQRERFLPEMSRYEKIGAFGLTEPDVGSGASGGLTTTARREGDTWILNGQKKWIGNATFGDRTVIWAKDAADGRVKGFVVDNKSPGFTAEKIERKRRSTCFRGRFCAVQGGFWL